MEVLELALSVPGCLWHWSIDLLEVELVLDCFFVDVRNHVWWLDERHRERRSHAQRERSLCLLLGEVHSYGLELLAESSLDIKRFNHHSSMLILLYLLEVLQINCEVLVELVSLTQFLVNHGANEIELLDVLGQVRVLQTFSKLFVDDLESLVPVLILQVNNYQVVVELSDIERTKTNIREVSSLATVTVHGVDG